MVRRVVLFWIVLCSVFLSADPLQYLVRTTPTATALDTHTGAATVWYSGDDNSVSANIGFSFPFNGSTYTSVNINSNGMLSFSSSNTEYVNKALTYNDEPQSIYPYWDDMFPPGLLGLDPHPIRYETLGSEDSERFVVTWSDMPRCSLTIDLLGVKVCLVAAGSYTFQTVLYKNGDIRFRYPNTGSNDAHGASATIGAQENTTNYDQYSYNTSSIDQTFDILYSYLPSISVSKTSCVINDPVNGTSNPKRIPGSTIRYAIQVSNSTYGTASNVFATDTVDSSAFDTSTIQYLQIQSGTCDCTGVSSADNNGPGGSADGVNPVILDYGSLTGVVGGIPTYKCGYFEVDVK
jgi:uncharacterized repeat protein (TIGR01451 family)